MEPEHCALCGDRLGAHGHDRVAELALCRRCFLGDVERVAAARGWHLWSEHNEFMIQEDMHYVTRVRVVLAREPALRLRCQRYRGWMAIAGLWRGRARSRDPLFEAKLRVWSPQPAQAERFLQRAGAESALFDVLGNRAGSQAEIRGAQIVVAYSADDPHTEGEVVARVMALAHHVEGFAADGG